MKGEIDEKPKERKVQLMLRRENCVAFDKMHSKPKEFEAVLGGKLQFTE